MNVRLVALTWIVVLAACSGSADPEPTTSSTSTTATSLAAATTTTMAESETPTGDRPADLILHNGQVVTVDGDFTIAEAVAVSEGTIVAVGSSADILTLAAAESMIVDLGGRTLMPGFVDPHTHSMQVHAPDLDGMRAGQEELLAGGTTTAGMPTVLPDHLGAFRELDATGDIVLRSHLYLACNFVCGEETGDFYLSEAFSRDPSLRLAAAGVKMFTDSGVCNAPAVSFEYPDTVPEALKDGGWTGNGQLYVSSEEVASVVLAVDSAGGYAVIHAIGDVAIATALQGIRDAGDLTQRHQLHHNSMSSLVDPDLLAVYGEAGMTPVMFPVQWTRACEEGRGDLWATIIPQPVLSTIEDRTAIADANPGIRFSWHGDAPSITGTPLQLMFPLVTAGYTNGVATCYPDEWAHLPTVSVEEAIRMTTINAAAAMALEDSVGSIEVGKVADFVILTADPFLADHEIGLASNSVLTTIIDGEIAWCNGDGCDLFETDSEEESVALPAGECLAAPDGLTAWWPGDESGDDVVGTNHGTLVEGASFGTGAVGGAFAINGGAVQLSAQPDFDGAFTIEAWVIFDGQDFNNYHSVFNNDQMFLRKNNDLEGGAFAIFIKLDDGSVEPRAQSITHAAVGEWTHLAGTWDGHELRLFVNGELEGASERSGTLAETSTPAQIGRGEQSDVIGPIFHGLIDELSLYDRALDADGLDAIFSAGSGGKCRG